jgi:glyoxylase-like metal-dependent hydrolase (beta-lactamase superfamily II)
MSTHWQLISDGTMSYPREFIFPRQQRDELAREGVSDEVVTPYNCLLVQHDDQTVLIDAGMGRPEPTDGNTGHLLASLAAAGITPDEVDAVIITHAHADHVGGLTRDRQPVFRRARHYVARPEWDFWMSDDPAAQLPEPLAEMLIATARTALSAIDGAGLLERVNGELSLAEGFRLIPAPGHTPGHLAVELRAGDPPLLYVADALIHELQFQHPTWISMVDHDPEATVKTRRSLLDRAIETEALVAAFHLPRTGRLTRGNGAYRFNPHRADHQLTQPRPPAAIPTDTHTPDRNRRPGQVAVEPQR